MSKQTYLYLILCTFESFASASFIERVKNLQIRASIERDDLPFPSEVTMIICSHLTFDEKKQCRVICKKFEQYMRKYIRVFPVKSLSDFLYFDYRMRSSGYLFRMQAKMLCEIQLPFIANIVSDISVQVVIMKKDDYQKVYSSEEYKQILNRSFFIGDRLGVYIFIRYKDKGQEKIELYPFGMRNLPVIFALAEALRKKDIEDIGVIPCMLLILFFYESNFYSNFFLWNWVMDCIESEFKDHVDSTLQECLQLKKRYSPSFCKKVKVHPLYPQDYLFLFINKNVPMVHVKDSNGLIVEVKNVLSLDTSEYKTLNEKFSLFTHTNIEKKVLFVLHNVYLFKTFIASSSIRSQDAMKFILYGIYIGCIFTILSLTSIGIYYRYLQMISQLYPTMKKHPHRKHIFGGELIVDLFL